VEPAAEQRSISTDSIVDVAGVQRAQALHPRRQTALRAVPEMMEVGAHQTVRVGHDPESVVDIGEPLAVFHSVTVVEEDRAAIDPTVHHVKPTTFDIGA
jgi:hypothetical protein